MDDLGDAGAVVVNPVIGQGAVALCHIHYTDAVGKASDTEGGYAVVNICKLLELHFTQIAESVIYTDVLQNLPGHCVEAAVQGFPDRNVSMVIAAAVGGPVLPFVVVNHAGGIILPGVESRAVINQGFNGAARLSGA